MKLTIKGKLILGFTIILVLLFAVLFFVVRKNSESNAMTQNIVDVSSRKISLSHEIMIGVLQACRYEKNLILEKDYSRKIQFKNNIYNALNQVELKVSELTMIADEKSKAILNDFNNTWFHYRTDLDELIWLSTKKGDDDAAAEISISKGSLARNQSISHLNKLITENELSMNEDKLRNERNYDAALKLSISLIVISVLVALIFTYWIIQSISKRIRLISEEAEKIASREFVNEHYKDHYHDEMRPIFNSLLNVNKSFREITENANSVAAGDYSVDFSPRSVNDTLGNALKTMTRSLRETTIENRKHTWFLTGQNRLYEVLSGDQDLNDLTKGVLSFLCSYLNAKVGVLWLVNAKKELVVSAQFGLHSLIEGEQLARVNREKLVQALEEQKVLMVNEIVNEQIIFYSDVLQIIPQQILFIPLVSDGETLAMIEMDKTTDFSEQEKEFISTSIGSITVFLNSTFARRRIHELLVETQVQSREIRSQKDGLKEMNEELQQQQEELKQMNEELEEQTQYLKEQKEELQITNEELEEHTRALEMKNKEIEASKRDIEEKNKQIELSSRYKSEFLANMSHELRTPLNSLLILAKSLVENKKKNLSADQVESAKIIFKSGSDLLLLINEVLDLSKIEAGKMSLIIEQVFLQSFFSNLIKGFKHQAEEKGLELVCSFGNGLPESIKTDLQRLNQILKNLLSNAVKFTDKGKVEVRVLLYSEDKLIITVSDTGIGIEKEKQLAIFEAFQQADGSTSRKYGGTGLGLSISRELARLLGAELELKSIPDKGSEFSVILPFTHLEHNEIVKPVSKNEPVLFSISSLIDSRYLNHPSIPDDREKINKDDKVILVIEEDMKFAEILSEQANKKGFKCLSADNGEDGLVLAAKYLPDAIILDNKLPGMGGQRVLEVLKENSSLRHIPVHVISRNDYSSSSKNDGKIEYLAKPIDKKNIEDAFARIENLVTRKVKNLLIIEDDENARKTICKLIRDPEVNCFEAATAKAAISIFDKNHIDCIILDLGLPDTKGFELVYQLRDFKNRQLPPIIVYTGKDLTVEENNELQKYTNSIIVKGLKSEERLLDETALFLHHTMSHFRDSKAHKEHSDKEIIFQNKKVLLTDDDSRNVFALTMLLEERGFQVVTAENGKVALEKLNKLPDIDLVLMDIMMPEMDGYEAMKQIRSLPKFRKLPIIALTAKAMKDDKQKCIDAGANDYISKPIDTDRLLSLMRVWLSK